ncbi:leucyl aminopeptidase [Cyanobium sp. WAJ14-Wanaka]|uniref:leucyl aminopeptidase n=1 Tax=Cyanobium sp. WAJ14-Wanaka TaxID=2823725 RepID=UPI0020CEB988|nr:leucyl aminopeptidase [Cyanobium sp. WAJ14-Wanaka]MCP9775160.1 leucyl aminopeptidase [Cyanobium sp. WAJ14-Wanaka]
MQFRCLPQDLGNAIASWEGDGLVVGLFAEAKALGHQATTHQALVQRFGPELLERLEQRRFKAKPGASICIERLGAKPQTLILVGLGNEDQWDLDRLRQAGAAGAKAAVAAGVGQLGLALPTGEIPAEAAGQAMAEAVRLSLFQDQRFKSESEAPNLPSEVCLLGLGGDLKEINRALEAVDAICSGVELARELVAAPPNVATPQHLADTASQIAQDFGLQYQVLERADCQALGMGAFLGVTQGSDLPPKFIHLTYRPQGGSSRRVALVGKGLTFDSGGYNLKTAGSQIEMMKFDMGGSGAVLGAARAIGQLQPEGVEVHFIVASCENMVSGGAMHPGDILTASNGKTIEINNTDAEGRLTLADALVYACKLDLDAVVDLATLTGACLIALGEEIAGLWSSSDGLAAALLGAGDSSGEPLWRMPLRPSYKQGLKSSIADMKNTGPRPGGSITAALFLQDFVSPNLPWAHLDIAGTAWSDKGRGMDPAGATGFGVRTLVHWVCQGAAT